ncbi:MAG: phosphate acyltransferase PlsX [Deltaproteobacteria bacterium]|jgi:glycerol-3-phosphate acyltransferase PlsX|nr:phosphate acyltransferase PlsX [Deltaproteobacteria bacterium]
MGGDFGPSVVVPGALHGAAQSGAALFLVGDETLVRQELARQQTQGLDLEVVHAPETISMGEKPSEILRRKKASPIQAACRLVAEGKAHGVVSPGHSGASLACGMFILGRVPGVERPALATIMPTEKAPVLFADVGANVDCRPHHLFQFGLMADAYAKNILNRPLPTIGLLSIGEEEGKGNSQVKEAYDIFKMAGNLNFIGNVEGRDLFSGNVDIIVCDGFVGNVVLKLSEGLSFSLTRILKRELLSTSLAAKVGTFLARGAFRRFAKVVDYAEYGGAPLLGLQGIIIVCHGRSNAKAITSAVKMAATFVATQTNERLIANITANEELTRYSKAIK